MGEFYMKRYLIPDLKNIIEYQAIAETYENVFEYNEFIHGDVLDDLGRQDEVINQYKQLNRKRDNDTIHGAFMDITVASYDRKIRELSQLRVRQSMDIAVKLGVKAVIFHTNYIPNFRLKSYCDNWVKANAIFWKEILDQYPALNVYVENMFDESPDLLVSLAEAMKEEERFGVCFDYAHASISPTSIDDWIKVLYPYIKHMHINDNNLIEDLHLPVGKGSIDWEEYKVLMERYRLEPTVLIEVNSIEKQKESIQYMMDHKLYPYN